MLRFRAAWLILTVCFINCGGESKKAASKSGGAPNEPELPLPSTPAQIRCGESVCDSETEYCCSGSGGTSVGGGSGFETCSTTACPYRRECDETADCVGTEICCYSVVTSPPAVLAGSCLQPAACAFDGYWQACGSQEDCAATARPACVAQDCAGATLQTCGPITRSVCKG